MLLLSALLRMLYHVLRLGVRVAGSVEIGRSHRRWSKTEPVDCWEIIPCKFDVDRFAPAPQAGGHEAAPRPSQPIDTATGLPSGNPIARPRGPE